MANRLVVEWTRLTLRCALIEGSGARARLRAIHCQPTRAPEEAAEELRRLLKAARVGPVDVIGVVPREQVITRVVRFPTMDPRELAQMVELYAKGQLPYPRDQAVMDFSTLSRAGGSSLVAVVACQREVIDRHVQVFRAAGLSSVALLTLSSWGVGAWYQRAVTPGRVPEPCLVVNVDDARTDLVMMGEGRILSSRSIGQGIQDWKDGTETVELLALEVERSRAAVRKELPETEPKSVLLTGVGVAAEWAEPLQQRLGLPVSLEDSRRPFKGAVIPTTPAVSPVVVGGIGLSDFPRLLNLSPPELRVQVRHRQQVSDLAVVGLLLFGVLALGSGILGVRMSRRYEQVSRLEQALTTIQPAARRAQETMRSYQLVDGILSERRGLARLVTTIFQATPAGITLDSLAFEGARAQVVLRGNGITTQDVLAYVRQLEAVDGVRQVQLRYSTRRVTSAGERTDFELVVSQRKETA